MYALYNMNKLYMAITKSFLYYIYKDSFIIIMDLYIYIVVIQPKDVNEIALHITHYCIYTYILLSTFLVYGLQHFCKHDTFIRISFSDMY